MDGTVAVYKGLPYASAPVGPLRWRPPKAPPAWRETRSATAYGPRCMQSDRLDAFTDTVVDGSGMSAGSVWLLKQLRPLLFGGDMSEDCLYLNVRTPDVAPKAKLPVMVWFHGGGYTAGAGSASVYNANGLPRREVVVVTLNYRLNIFGFFAHPALRAEDPDGAVGNYGLRDQVAALEWVRDNIAAFGGDPNNVTIFGESAGAYSVASLMTSPLSKGLFHRAIGQSGCGVTIAVHATQPVSTYRAAETVGAEFAVRLMDSAEPSLDKLRALDAGRLTDATFGDSEFLRHQRPVVDGVGLAEAMGLTFERGATHAVPWLLGWNSDEGTVFTDMNEAPIAGLKMNPTDAATYDTLLTEVFPDAMPEARRHFPPAPSIRDAKARLYGETRFAAPCWWAGQRHAAAGNPTYLYLFTRAPPANGQTIGAYHAAEIPFVFDSHPPLLPRDQRDEVLTEAIGDYWAQFARTGDPNHSAGVTWRRFSAPRREMLHLDPNGIRMAAPVGAARYDFLERRTTALNRKAARALQAAR